MTSKSKKTTAKINGLTVENITYDAPRNGLPKFVRQAAGERGYGDATQALSLFVNEQDIEEAFSCAAQGNGSSCVMAQAGTRLGAKAVYFFRTTVWVDFGDGPIVRFNTSKSIYNNVIDPFDKGNRDRVRPGIYHLTPPSASRSLAACREREEQRRATGDKNPPGKKTGSKLPRVQSHTERVVMASRVA